MIPKISRGSDPAGLVKYLFGKGRHNEHANQHLVACSDDLLVSFGFDGHPDESYAKIGERVYGQINVYGVTTKSERHKRSYWTRTADGNGIGGRKAPVPYGS